MTKIRILLQGGHVYETFCGADAPLLEQLRQFLTAGGAGLAQLQIEQEGRARGLAIPFSQIVAVETEPPVVWQHRDQPGAIRPAPYIRIPGFLSTEENAAVLDFAVRKQPEFRASTVEGGRQGYRHSQVLMKFDDMGLDFAGRVRELVPEAAQYFGLDIPAGYDFEMQMTTHGDGDYFRIHSDNGSPSTASRILTYVYYFSRDPLPFSGGHLRLYDDSRVDPSSWIPVATFADITPQNNMLLLFPSRAFHEVLPTLCRTTDFASGRFTINGWIRSPAIAVS
ncbi:MAG: 2OG-Fe(II) oxygenase [Xanthobacteraceae bacterium]|nr:2OG-Fe(II) oxygenase [Xanthobacteraceae bacterium]